VSNPDDDAGDVPDTIDGRLTVIARLVDALADERNDTRRARHALVVVRACGELVAEVTARVAMLLDRLDNDG